MRRKKYICDKCKKLKVTNRIYERKYNVEDEEIIFSFLKCNNCSAEFVKGFDNQRTLSLKDKISRYKELKLDNEVIINLRKENKNESLYIESLLREHKEFINNNNIYGGNNNGK